ncbi:MAG: DUF4870 domain-containing protein [Anaerolineales bacterium]
MSNSTSSTSNQDERVMAALAHISALMPFMGVVVPIVIWVTQKDKSQYVAFQALQAAAYQLSMIVAWFIGMGCYMCSFFSMFLSAPFSSSSETPQNANPLIWLTFLIPFLVFGAIFLGGFAFIAYGFVGAVMAIQGKSFRYILIGKQVKHFMQPKQDAPVSQ